MHIAREYFITENEQEIPRITGTNKWKYLKAFLCQIDINRH